MTPQEHLRIALRDHPGILAYDVDFRSARGRALPSWPDWCYVPLAAAREVVSTGNSVRREHAAQVARIGALAAWRAHPLVWREAEPAGEMPSYGELRPLLLEQLPRWCTWIQPAEARPAAFVHLEHNVNDGRTELRLALDINGQLVGASVDLAHESLSAALDDSFAESLLQTGILSIYTVQAAHTTWLETFGAYLPFVARLAARPELAQVEVTPPATVH